MEEATERSALISLTNSSFGSAPFRQVKVRRVVSSPAAPAEGFNAMTNSFRCALARNQFTVMNSQVITKEAIRKMIVIVTTAAGDLLSKRQQLLVNLAIRFAIVNRNCVVAAIADDD